MSNTDLIIGVDIPPNIHFLADQAVQNPEEISPDIIKRLVLASAAVCQFNGLPEYIDDQLLKELGVTPQELVAFSGRIRFPEDHEITPQMMDGWILGLEESIDTALAVLEERLTLLRLKLL